MNLAVKFWQNEENNPEQIPGNWPSQVIENCNIPPDNTWIIMTKQEYEWYREDNQQVYKDWWNSTPEEPLEENLKEKVEYIDIDVEDPSEEVKQSLSSRIASFFKF